MKTKKVLVAFALGLMVAVSGPMLTYAQHNPEVVAPPRAFKTAEEHYNYLLAQARGGTKHTYESVPKWEGLWEASYNNIAISGGVNLDLSGGVSPFFVGPIPPGVSAGGEVAEGVLTPEYEAAFKQRREHMLAYNEQPYDRLTTCEAPGVPRWLLEPYVREFVNTPDQSWWLNDLANETRRVYINQEHKNIDGSHSPTGDSIGFWNGDKLIVWTNDMWPADYFRGYPPFSNEMEIIEVYELKTLDNGMTRLEAQVTFYDPVSLVKPLSGVYTWTRATQIEDAGYRIRHWNCDANIQQKTENNETTIRLPGESGKTWHEMRNPDLPADLSGQTKTPGETDFDDFFGAAEGTAQ
ncbi:hypothetical protein DEVEQU_00962 [Devosia equisanguinis]|uniref:DUF1329 domain-containing protein n=1 Tax=Devosia equisanguinis TaxID=2490941 RepID=A0A3S5D393_9HYPH|nr:hypothetical protein [Devosia equisanguinis]VDS03833.1 hypothetical protein DEVEQU_00962 [Devosia equisanguinis]